MPALAGVGKGKRGVTLAKKELVLAATTRSKLRLETTRGKEEPLTQKSVEKTELNGAAVEVKQRGGWKREILPDPVLYELPEHPGKE